MSQIEKDLKESIKKNLPSQIGDVLQDRLRLIPDLERKIDSLNEQVKQKEEQIEGKDSKIIILQDKVEILEALELRENEISQREKNQEINELQIRLNANEQRCELATKYLETIFGNNVMKTNVMKNKTNGQQDTGEYYYDENNNYVPIKSDIVNEETTTEQEG